MKVLLGMSGGVDSSVAAILLQEQGYEVIGATMILWQENENVPLVEDAKNVCKQLGIEHHTIDLRTEFKKYVIDNFINCYKNALTPNPCVECNRYIKFGVLYQKAIELDCEYIATGHYAKVEFDDKYNQYVLKKSNAEKKDQSYFLYGISKEILPKILFPLNEFTDKQEIRKIAEKKGLQIAKKPDSQEICFIPNDDYSEFLNQNIKNIKPGDIITQAGEILGRHNGIINYTVGQRKGLGIAYKEPLYVLHIDVEHNQVIVGTESELYSDTVEAINVNYLVDIDKAKPITVKAKVRYRGKEQTGRLINVSEGKIKVQFDEQVKSPTSGQSIVLYDEDIVIGGGIIIMSSE